MRDMSSISENCILFVLHWKCDGHCVLLAWYLRFCDVTAVDIQCVLMVQISK